MIVMKHAIDKIIGKEKYHQALFSYNSCNIKCTLMYKKNLGYFSIHIHFLNNI